MIMVFIFTPIHINFTHKHQFIEIIGKKNNHMNTKGIKISAFCPVCNLLFYSNTMNNGIYQKCSWCFFNTHIKYKIFI